MATPRTQLTPTGPNSEPPLADLIRKQTPAMAAALPKHLDADRLTRIALTEVRRNPKLGDCTSMSVLGALMQAAQLGLEPGPLGHSYLVPYGRECQFQVGYTGLIELARRSGLIETIVAREVREGDDFEYAYGDNEHIHHVPALRGRGDIIAVYATARFTSGARISAVMSVEDVEPVRARSKAARGGPWVTDWAAMAKKTAVKQLRPWLPLSPELADAFAADGAVISLDGNALVATHDDAIDARPAPEAIAAETVELPDGTIETVAR